MSIELVKEKYAGAINAVTIGRDKTITIGGQTAFPCLYDEGAIPSLPAIAYEIYDSEPTDWPDELIRVYGDVLKEPVRWARHCVETLGATALCIRLASAHADAGNRPSESVVASLKEIVHAVQVPLIIVGCGDDDKDNDLLPKASQAVKGRDCLFGVATQTNYKTLSATCLADGHSIIADSPIDVNIAKQLNILISDMGFDPSRIVMHPTTTALGYGMEYVYSIMERSRLAAFMNDRMLSMPFLLFAGQEAWKVKEAKESAAQGINWELATATALIQAGADILIMRHPAAIKATKKYIQALSAR